jgi:Flp pilus assembly protein TadB
MTAALLLITAAVLIGTARTGRTTPHDRRTDRKRLNAQRARSEPIVSARISAVVAAAAVVALLPTPTGLVLAVAVALGAPVVIGRLQSNQTRAASVARTRTVPLALDLLAAAWRAGVPMRAAVEGVAEATPPPLRADLELAAARLALGADAEQAWVGMDWGADARAAHDALVTAGLTGASPVETLHRSAQQARDARRRRGEAAARAVAVRVAGPLGLCFLPAFVLLAIAPAVLGAIGPALR